MNGEDYSKIFFILVLAILTLASFWILQPFLIVLIGAGILAYVFFPVYKKILNKTKSKNLSAVIIILAIILLIAIPSVYLTSKLTKEGVQLYIFAKQKISSGKLINIDCEENDYSFACNVNRKTHALVSDSKSKFYLETVLSKIATFVVNESSDFLFKLPQTILYLFVMLFTVFYLLIDHTLFFEKIKDWIPLKKTHKEDILLQFSNLTHATIYGQFIVALIQGGIATIAYAAFGVSSPMVWGLLTTFFALIPFVGTTIIWLPISLSFLINAQLVRGIGLLLVGIFIISSIDNILKPRIIGKRAKLHPVLILVGVVGGLVTMGLIGIIVGPLIISLLLTFVEVYHKERRKS